MLVQTLHCPEEFGEDCMELERRAVVRFLCDREVSYAPLLARERLWARLRDISVNGIGLLVDAPIKRGTDLAIDMKTVHPGISLTLVARVVHATKQEEGSWIVGCQFLTRPTEAQVQALL